VWVLNESTTALSKLKGNDAEYSRLLVSDVTGSLTRKEQMAVLVSHAKVADGEKKVALIEKLMKNLDETKSVPGEPETAAFFRKFHAGDFQMHAEILRGKKRFFVNQGNKLFSKDIRELIKRDYKDFAYLTEDWNRSDAWAKAIGPAVRGGKANSFINAEGKAEKLEMKEFEGNPDQFSVITVSSKNLGIKPKKRPKK